MVFINFVIEKHQKKIEINFSEIKVIKNIIKHSFLKIMLVFNTYQKLNKHYCKTFA